MRNKMLMLLVVMGVLAGSAFAQTTLNTTTLAAAITTPSPTQGPGNQVTLASLGSGASAVLAGQVLFVDGEAMLVRTVPTTGTTVTVLRGRGPTRTQTHANGAIVYYGDPRAFVSGSNGIQFYEGTCTGNQNLFLPVVDVVNAQIGTCQNSTWVWYKLAAPMQEAMPRTPVSDAAYTALITDHLIAYTAITAARAVTLPAAGGLTGKVMIIKDESGSVTAVNKITIVGTVDGQVNPNAVTSAFGVFRIYSNGTNWFSF